MSNVNIPYTYKGHNVLFGALVGSHNYNLHGEDSDKDYKIFFLPTFKELYKGQQFSDSKIGEQFDFDVHDIRHVAHLWWKANINFIEVLYSSDINVPYMLPYQSFIDNIFRHKDLLVTMNLPYLWNACFGMHHQKMAKLDKGTSGTKNLVELYGYDTKQALHAYRVLDFLERFAETEFKDFKQAMTYNDQEREVMLKFKNGEFTLKEYIEIAVTKKQEVEAKYRAYYLEQKPKHELKDWLETLVMDLVKAQIKRELV